MEYFHFFVIGEPLRKIDEIHYLRSNVSTGCQVRRVSFLIIW